MSALERLVDVIKVDRYDIDKFGIVVETLKGRIPTTILSTTLIRSRDYRCEVTK